MARAQSRPWIFRNVSRAAGVGLMLVIMFGLSVVATQTAQAQTYRVVHNFSDGVDGANPRAGLSIDRAGNLYGTASNGGLGGAGVTFRLTHSGSNWIDSTVYSFSGYNDGGHPEARVIFGPDGSLYGTTVYGGGGNCYGLYEGCGAVFSLKPGASACRGVLCGWTGTVLYGFRSLADGAYPYAEVVFDQAGNLYGTTSTGSSSGCGGYGCGMVFKLTPSTNGWIESIRYSFSGGADGASPRAGVVLDRAGNLYGTTTGGGSGNNGTVFQLTSSGINILHTFQGASDGSSPYAGLLLDSAGNLYGATSTGGSRAGGTVFELSPSGGGYTTLYSFAGTVGGLQQGPIGNLIMDSVGNLYGTTAEDPSGNGSVFKLTHHVDGSWTYTSLYDFCSGGPPCSDGRNPYSSLVFDENGNLYGTASLGGANQDGVVFEITP